MLGLGHAGIACSTECCDCRCEVVFVPDIPAFQYPSIPELNSEGGSRELSRLGPSEVRRMGSCGSESCPNQANLRRAVIPVSLLVCTLPASYLDFADACEEPCYPPVRRPPDQLPHETAIPLLSHLATTHNMTPPDSNASDEHAEFLQFAGLMAHQLKSPIAAAASLLNAVLGEHAGPLTARQKKALERMDGCLSESLQAMRRMLDIVRPQLDDERAQSLADVIGCLQRVESGVRQALTAQNIAFAIDTSLRVAYARLTEAALIEILSALLSNAIKYTPNNGNIRVDITPLPDSGTTRISVSDSGIGIPEENRERVFEPFFRTLTARSSDRPGVGLGLAFVSSVVHKSGGAISAHKSDMGGAMIVVDLPAVSEDELGELIEETGEPRMRVVIVGGVAAGPKAAAKIIRLMPDADVTIIEKGKVLSYAGCGLPYYVSGAVRDERELTSTPVGVVRDSVFFQKVKNVHVRGSTEAVEIDRGRKVVRTRSCVNGSESSVPYDKLVLATGASPVRPPIPGVDKLGVFTLHGVSDAEGIKAALASGMAHDVVIVGGGLVGVEMTEALVSRGCRVTIVELESQVLHILDWEIARLVEKHMEAKGVRVMTNTRVTAIEGRSGKPERASRNGPGSCELIAARCRSTWSSWPRGCARTSSWPPKPIWRSARRLAQSRWMITCAPRTLTSMRRVTALAVVT